MMMMMMMKMVKLDSDDDNDNGGSFHVKWCKPGHDPSLNLIRFAKLLPYVRYDNP